MKNSLNLSGNTMKNKWSLVIHEATQNRVSIWGGTQYVDLQKSNTCIVKQDNQVASCRIFSKDWHRPFKKVPNLSYKLTKFERLFPNTTPSVDFKRLNQNINRESLDEAYLVRGQFRRYQLGYLMSNHLSSRWKLFL